MDIQMDTLISKISIGAVGWFLIVGEGSFLSGVLLRPFGSCGSELFCNNQHEAFGSLP